ncbi:hypothetical protein AALO_G00087840 [Alosa alosa]|uniref:Uncharacterized protein n=1 Tax=Alosa alosa TaxID=278164 RepID=A0AAV6H114_9TELE|nr:sterile alpha motif domain-containing protein 14 [Alosa alosa]KAG5280329.1 hypothetical protein AALO_G00087840 [Alosa alosa]
MSSSENGHKGDVFDLTEAVPQTQRLDTSLQKAKAQLSIRRHRPSRSRLRDSLSSIEDDSLDRKSSQSYSSPLHSSCSPLHSLLQPSSSASPDLPAISPAQRGRAFTFDPCLMGPALAEVRRRHRPLQSDSSQEALLLSPVSSPSSARLQSSSGAASMGSQQQEGPLSEENRTDLHHGDRSHPHKEALSNLHQGDHSPSEDDSHGTDEAGSPTVLLDKKTKRRFLDLGVTLRRTYGKVRKDRANRIESTETRPSRSSAPSLVPFSWFSERMRSSGKSGTQTTAKADSSPQEKVRRPLRRQPDSGRKTAVLGGVNVAAPR